MRAVKPPSGRVRYHCRSKAQGIGCKGGGSFLDIYEQQLASELANFILPADWQQLVLQLAQEEPVADPGVAQRRQQLEVRLERLKDLYGWGDLEKAEYLAERDRVERELSRLQAAAPEAPAVSLARLAAYVESLPRAWADATQEQRHALVSLIYEELWVDGPELRLVKPTAAAAPLFGMREGAAQPTPVGLMEVTKFAEATPMGIGFASANICTGSMMNSSRHCAVARSAWVCPAG
jgi:hypothetical protein